VKGANNCLPRALKGLYTLTQCAILRFASSVCCPVLGAVDRYWGRVGHARTEGSVLSLKFTDATLEGRELRFALVAAVLSCDTVAMGTSLLALLGCHTRPGALSRWGITFIRRGCRTRFCCRLGGRGWRK